MLFGYCCSECGTYWCCQAQPDEFEAITRWCPLCLPKFVDAVPETMQQPTRRRVGV